MANGTQIRAGQPEGVTLYDREGVRVTERFLVAGRHRYEIRHLRHLQTLRGPRSPLHVNASVAAGVLLIAVVSIAGYLGSPGWLGVVAICAVPLAVIVFAAATGPRSYELWSDVGGYSVVVFSDDNAERYHQVVRAIVRAKERANPERR